MKFELDPLIQIMAEAIDPEAFTAKDALLASVVLERRNALAKAKAGIRIAQALGWRFLPPGDFEVLSESQLDAMNERANANLRAAGDILEQP